MPICVTGMHRSGTSMVARVLHELGVDLGPVDQLIPADAHNADGYWENRRLVELSEAVLDELGGGWDVPPASADGWDSPALEPLYREATDVLSELNLAEPWAWKDPRAALTLGFWRRLRPDVKLVVCVRHPLEVALSLQRRGATSPPLALSLWQTYNERLLEVPSDERVVVHYDRFLAEPRAEIAGLADGLGLAAGEDDLERAAAVVKRGLRHHGARQFDLDGIRLPPAIEGLYDELRDGRRRVRRGPEVAGDGADDASTGAQLVRTVSLLQERDGLRGENEGLARDRDNWRDAAQRAAEQVDRLRNAHERHEAERREFAAAEAEVARLGAALDEAVEERARADDRVREVERTLERLAAEQEGRAAELRHAAAAQRKAEDEVEALRGKLEATVEERRLSTARAQELELQLQLLQTRAEELQRRLDLDEVERQTAASELRAVRSERDAARDEARRAGEELARLRSAEERHEGERADRAAADAETGRLAALLEAAVAARTRADARVDEVEGELDELGTKLDRALEERQLAAARIEDLELQLQLLAARADELQRRLDAAELERESTASEVRGLTADRDNWRDEAGRLVDDRDNWRVEAQNWRRETERLMATEERRLSQRMRRLAFRVARSVWWALPRGLRDFLRPVIFRSARVSSAAAAVDDLPRPAPTAPGLGGPVPATPALAVGPVSVLIPTLNAGPEFARLLSGVAAQEGVESVELIVVDSGSTDGTREIAAAAGARVVQIAPEEFGHGRTRNQAAELATSDVLVFAVQDALLLGRTALRDLAAELQADPRLAGVSARQIPRSDADLYGAFVTWSHDHVLRSARAGLNGGPFEKLDPLSRRAAAALDDVCAAVRREVWAEFRFDDIGFAEDLDFAVRAARSGWTFALSNTVAVAHSHDRDSVYHLRRSIADRLYVSPLMNDSVGSRTYGWEAAGVLAATSVLLEKLAGAASLALSEQPRSLGEQLAKVALVLDADGPRLTPTGELARLAEFVELEGGAAAADDLDVTLVHELNALLRWPPLVRFAAAQAAAESAELHSFTAKLAASVIGRALGDAARSGASRTDVSRLLAGV